MSKIIVEHSVKSSLDDEVTQKKKGILKDNCITYNVDGIIKLNVNDNIVLFEKENDSIKINLKFEKNKSIITKYFIKDLNTEIKLETKTKELIINENSIFVKYDLYMNGEFSDTFEYKIEWRDL